MSNQPKYQIIQGDVRTALRDIPDGTVHCCVTSPPYWGLRDYGTAQWEGGDAGCDHLRPPLGGTGKETLVGTTADGNGTRLQQYRDTCGKCGAKRIDSQIGQEPTPDAYVETMVEVFREVRRVLHDSGTVWLNVGDSYAGSWGAQSRGGPPSESSTLAGNGHIGGGPKAKSISAVQIAAHPKTTKTGSIEQDGLKPKDLCLIPWRLALALQADGWWVRSVICWAKKSCMPESVTDRPTNSWEPIFLLAKNARYYYDAEAVKEPSTGQDGAAADFKRTTKEHLIPGQSAIQHRLERESRQDNGTRNQRNVWHLGPEPYAEAHFATFPTEIPRRAILAGTSAKGCCPKCRAPWGRVVERQAMEVKTSEKGAAKHAQGLRTSTSGTMTKPPESRTVGWDPGCECNAGEPVPCTVLDPFSGAATTGLACLKLGRYYLGVELNAAYIALSHKRLADAAMPTLFDAPQPPNGLQLAFDDHHGGMA